MTELHSDHEQGRRKPPQHPGLDLVRATEGAALAASRFMGRGDRLGADHAAQVAMFNALNLLPMKGRIVSGELNVDESLLTGESMPALRATGAAVVAGLVRIDQGLGVGTREVQPQGRVHGDGQG